jgi:dipeptidyl-peptidase III
LFASDDLVILKQKATTVTEVDWDDFLQYCACFYGNMGNYLSFGDTKFVPRCPSSSFRSILAASTSSETLLLEWDKIAEEIYDLSPSKRQMGLDGTGISTYYSADIRTEEIKAVQGFLADQKLGDQVIFLFPSEMF